MAQKSEAPHDGGATRNFSCRGQFRDLDTLYSIGSQYPARPGPVLMRHYFRDDELAGMNHG